MFSKPQVLQWQKSSYLYRLVGWLSDWRKGSWLLQWSEAIAACLISLVFLLSPFVSTSLIGVLLIAVAAYWVINAVSTSKKVILTPVHILIFLYWCVACVATAFSPV